ncbi:PaaI family thioesterase [Parerythrobacter lacustris]|uniref:PaaI family thioesterase n=1 Tax=Parerythrobacter lacustris TaxID=2969984 RepID=A0ABT1XQR6_9SPHN|nr:PaaI family thioesterase [Parerythrobacter lacustris]MCR2833981.1 PaaI family thioesterase [Parerythrobacter lacustris]
MSEPNDAFDALYRTMGLVRVVTMDPQGRATLEYEAKPEQCHSGGVVQGGFVTGWIDAAMAHASIALNGPQVVPMSLELKVSFFAPVRPGLVIAEGWAERNGRRTGFYEGHLMDAQGNVLAKGTSTIMLMDRNRVEQASKDARG